ncbi:MAG: PaaI family thioesterase, partial [Psittacicella sp.]
KSNSFVLSLKVTKDHLQAVNIVHGGVLSSLAESCASISAYYNCKLNFKNSFPVALNLNSSYFKEVKEGLTIYARSKCEKSGLNIQFWSVEIYNDKYIFATFKINFLNKTIKIH